MTGADRWLLPDGIDEILPPQARRIEQLRRHLLDYLDNCGYDFVIPPALEYLDSLLTGTGKDLDLRTFKVTDQLSGRLMGLSADTTPQVARIDAHSLAPEGTSRLSYCRTVFHTRPASLLASRTPTQIGAELYGVAGTSADVEIISVMLSLLSEAGIEGVHLDLGNVGVFRALADSAGLSDEQQSELFDLLKLKCQTDTLAWVERELSDSRLTEAFSLVASMQGSASALTDKFARLAELVPVAAQQLSDMTQAIEALMQRFPQVSITCDLTELRGYDYHTGLVFAAYVPGYGDAVAQGGRYDETGADFGRARPATGFSADLKVLAALGQRQFEAKETVAAPASDDPSLWQAITDLRTKGYRVVTEANGDVAGASQRLQQNDGQWILVSA
ncbi:MAG: ATP phosphoribosyltransferase regulatory subunit [Oceanospirillaceae bacterium]|jgi:ATP phosphoribosyltransferase regulatory subunit|uniref:ATP phosphoribosyltransferase regulatory subunit n=1 Tax=unclassified Thalassolituus TaxID=2624967 RepID=UPI000B67053A|nr:MULTISPECIES: ATP phosphoribosyltransferase regulatory subunit [unclassified Thalassolituus]MAE34691.1 ATP phosphoribosyltransferase regulatory subunit [Oceanospirillaceae bacterium]OUX65865.1 MAG: ATP phosphoribosyltransferase regulatory subunit [Oceanospirillaceae bacterium TMED276]MBN56763.1 ATP phosphoribosyltransferase regulatory subunit [Oceanospirillaceae bacterium]MDQ4423406.1 ATP phosphoribosyltransferase regulatory subunit [Thalassolituus sp.]MDQ4426293.1 ATP phosphoribosyltransfe|tara:strand:+ start:30338 stop:31504 length:1167 start_codon:yes stop_codon:yes gene_type:complete